MEAQQRDALFVVKLTALVADHLGAAVARATAVAGGAALVHDGTAWVLAEDSGARALGPAMAWAAQQGTSRVEVVAADGATAGVLARRAAHVP